ncbi:hypothetical protein DXB24_24645 [Lachnospiraceae bacterium OM02-3]|nr:hypothetical protein DXB24_24645 [Lachnospiraceae bacterium OM02-3]
MRRIQSSAPGICLAFTPASLFTWRGDFGTSAFDCPFWIAGYPLEGYFNVADNPPADKYKPAPLQSLFGW